MTAKTIPTRITTTAPTKTAKTTISSTWSLASLQSLPSLLFATCKPFPTPPTTNYTEWFAEAGEFTVERREVIYLGRVQGVGFRYTASRIASRHQVVGFVANRPDGSVELVVEGSNAEIDRFLAEVAHAMRDNIQEARVANLAPTGEFTDFRIWH